MKITKGQYEYVNYKKKSEGIKTLILYLIPIALFLMGYFTTHTKANLLTIVAVLGCLPASKMLISFIMNLRVKCVGEDIKSKIDSNIGQLNGLYNLYFTSYDCNFYLSHLVITNDSIIGLSLENDFKEEKFKTHLIKHLKLDGLTGISIKVFNNIDTYVRRLNELNKLDTKLTNNQIQDLILNITL